MNETKKNNTHIFQLSNHKIGLAVFPYDSTETFSEQTVDINVEEQKDVEFELLNHQKSENINEQNIRIILPKTLLKDADSNKTSKVGSIQLVYYKDDSLFPTLPTNERLISKTTVISGVFSLNVGIQKYVNLTEDMKYTVAVPKKYKDTGRGRFKCVYWDFEENSKFSLLIN